MDVLSLMQTSSISLDVCGKVIFPHACMQFACSLGHFGFLLEALYCHRSKVFQLTLSREIQNSESISLFGNRLKKIPSFLVKYTHW